MFDFAINIHSEEGLYIKDPLQTDLGRKILEKGIIDIAVYGLENFNFKKLAIDCQSTEASMYRYFENKYHLLAYLASWYWSFINFHCQIENKNIREPLHKLYNVIDILNEQIPITGNPDYISIQLLRTIIKENGLKINHVKDVDTKNKQGFFLNYKMLILTISQYINELDSTFLYPKTLATNIVELSMNNEFYLEHLPRLADQDDVIDKKEAQLKTAQMLKYYIERLLRT